MDKLQRMFATFKQRISTLSTHFVSEFVWAQEVAKYEIFCHIFRQFIMHSNELRLVNLLDEVAAQKNAPFLLQVIGLIRHSVSVYFFLFQVLLK